MRANACEGGRATEGVWSLMGLVVEPVFRGSRLLQKTVMEATRSPQQEGREFRPNGHEGHTMAIPALITSDRFHSAT